MAGRRLLFVAALVIVLASAAAVVLTHWATACDRHEWTIATGVQDGQVQSQFNGDWEPGMDSDVVAVSRQCSLDDAQFRWEILGPSPDQVRSYEGMAIKVPWPAHGEYRIALAVSSASGEPVYATSAPAAWSHVVEAVMPPADASMSLEFAVPCCPRYLTVAWLDPPDPAAGPVFSLLDADGQAIASGNGIDLGGMEPWPAHVAYGNFRLVVEQDVTPAALLGLAEPKRFAVRVDYSPGYTQW